jgi:hypothetical protein
VDGEGPDISEFEAAVHFEGVTELIGLDNLFASELGLFLFVLADEWALGVVLGA